MPVRERRAMHRSGEYADRGEYHRHLDPTWSYYPLYLQKMQLVSALIRSLPQNQRCLDIGAGEGVLVEQLRAAGHAATGIDPHYSSRTVRRGSAAKLPFRAARFDVVFCLDVLEHLPWSEQEQAIAELRRVLRPGGLAVLSLPNLAHLPSRVKFLLTGRLIRTSHVRKHVGDRPIAEYLDLLSAAGLRLEQRAGGTRFGEPLLPPLLRRFPSLCFSNFLVLRAPARRAKPLTQAASLRPAVRRGGR